MLGVVSAAKVPNAIESGCITTSDETLTPFFSKPLILFSLTGKLPSVGNNDALSLPSPLLLGHDLVPRWRKASDVCPLDENSFTK
ncbi:hypothetical protein HanRHA438_Chr16g0763021 [Helianthus annuus]|nr:hypothetical protein HanRHA438_Chr16g0763021 [Helianthus annuus]